MVNSCCFFFSLKTGTIIILVYELLYLATSLFHMDILFTLAYNTGKDRESFSGILIIGAITKSISTVIFLLFLICIGLAIYAIVAENNKLLLPLLVLKIPIIIVGAINCLIMLVFFIKNKSKLVHSGTQSAASALLLIVWISEGLLVYFWMVIYSYYQQSKGPRGGYPHKPRIGGYPRAQAYADPRAAGPPGAYGGPPPYGANPYASGYHQPPQTNDGFFFDKDKRTGDQPLTVDDSSHSDGSPVKGKSPLNSGGVNDNVPVEQK